VKTEREPAAGIAALPGFPVVLVTCDRNVMTAAAFSFCSFRPPAVMVGIRPKNLTHDLIRERREFGVNIPSRDQLDAVRACGAVSGRLADKFVEAGLTAMPARRIGSVLVAECPVNLECRVIHEFECGGTHRWFVGEIVTTYVADDHERAHALMYWDWEYRGVGETILRESPL